MLKLFVLITTGVAFSFALNPIDSDNFKNLQLIEPRQNELTYRLPTNVQPLKYTLDIYVDVDNNIFSGNVTIRLQITEPTISIHLNYKEINVSWTTAALSLENTTMVFPVISEIDRSVEQIYELYFGQTLAVGIYILALQFDGLIRNDLTGLYKSSYSFVNETLSETRYLAATHLEPTYARSIFPCFDEPALKARFEVRIYHGQKFRVISNMPTEGEPQLFPNMNSFYLTRFQETSVQMSTYLLAFVIAEEYAFYTEPPELLKIYASSHEINRVQFAQNFAVRALNYYKDWLNLDYQLPKLDMVNIPDFLFGAMENWGLILYRDPLLYRDDDITSIPVRTQQSGALLLTHELAHMWFGNEVTPEFWTYIWLSEGIARFFEYYITDKLIPEWSLMNQFLVTNFQSSLSQDDKLSARAMSTNVAEPDVINQLFDYIVYAKSACVIRMFQNVIGMDAFETALKSYISDRSYSTTNPDHLFRHLQESINGTGLTIPETIKNLFETWSDHPGYPVVKVTRNTSTNTILFEQSRFFVNPSEATGQTFPSRWIPINFATSVNRDFENTQTDFWISPNSNEESRTLIGPGNDNWIVVNKMLTGYYRVQYDQHNYDLLITTVNSDNLSNIHVLNRAQLLDDAINLAKARLININIAFGFLNSLSREVDLPNSFAPWATANNALTYLNDYLRGHERYNIFERFVANISSAAYSNVPVNAVETRHLHRIHRLSVAKWACLMGLEVCLQDVNEVVKGMLDGSIQIIDEIKDFVYCSASKYSDELTEMLSTHLLTLFLTARNDNLDEINRIITGLGCSTNETIISGYLLLTLGTNAVVPLTAADRIYIFRAIAAGSDTGLSMALEYLSTNFLALRNSFGADSIGTLFNYLGSLINSQQQIQWINNIIVNVGSLTTEQSDAARAGVNRARQNIEWIEYHGDAIFDWLTTNDETSTQAPSSTSAIIVNIGVLMLAVVSLKFVS